MTFIRLMAILAVVAAITQTATGQTVMEHEHAQQILGSVQVDQTPVTFLIAYSADAAILEMALPLGGADRYAPLFASTYRGIPAVGLDVYVSDAKDEIWVRSSWPDAQVLAYHHLGSDTAITPFGQMALLHSPFPDTLNGGPIAFPQMDPQRTQKAASFHIYDKP